MLFKQQNHLAYNTSVIADDWFDFRDYVSINILIDDLYEE